MRPSKAAALAARHVPAQPAASPGTAATTKPTSSAARAPDAAVSAAKAAAFTKAHAEGLKEGQEHAQWVAEMCSLAGAPTAELVHMLKSGMDRNAVRHRLSATRNAAIGAEPQISGHHLAGLSESAGSSWGEIYRANANRGPIRNH